MSPTDFRAALSRLGLKQIQAARLLATVPNTVSKYANGRQPIPALAQRLLDACERHPDLVPLLLAWE